jgi:hypothetical protein
MQHSPPTSSDSTIPATPNRSVSPAAFTYMGRNLTINDVSKVKRLLQSKKQQRPAAAASINPVKHHRRADMAKQALRQHISVFAPKRTYRAIVYASFCMAVYAYSPSMSIGVCEKNREYHAISYSLNTSTALP